MCDDMDKQITECYRIYDSGDRKVREGKNSRECRRMGLDQLPKQESMRKHGGFEFGENLAPLYRFLDSAVGRPWDDVYSEICSTISSNSTIGAHVIQHVWDRVKLNCVERDGKVFTSEGHDLARRYRWRSWDVLYVAEDGILKKAPAYRGPVLEKLYDVCLRSESTDFRFDYYRRRGGRWQKAVLYAPGQKVDRGNAQRIVPVYHNRQVGGFAAYEESREILSPSGRFPKYGKIIFDWVHSWKTLSSREATRLNLDHRSDFMSQRIYELHTYDPRPAEPLREDQFRELLRKSKDREKNVA